jgi:putative nucleotidyltransferase with HDIG domain
MQRIDELEKKVRALYEERNPSRAEWADWLYENHVFVVADTASSLAKRFNADEELAKAAAMLHDIADAKMNRFDERHEEENLRSARELLSSSGYSEDETQIVVDDAIRYHSCREGQRPMSLEGQVLVTADALAHFQTDFYDFATREMKETISMGEVQDWVLKKTERDFNAKICFDEAREEVRPDFERIREQFGGVVGVEGGNGLPRA